MGHHHDLLGVTQARQSTNLTGHQINEIAHKDRYPGSPCTRLLLGTTTHPRTEPALLAAPAALHVPIWRCKDARRFKHCDPGRGVIAQIALYAPECATLAAFCSRCQCGSPSWSFSQCRWRNARCLSEVLCKQRALARGDCRLVIPEAGAVRHHEALPVSSPSKSCRSMSSPWPGDWRPDPA
jgi:hypothetical protein